MSTTNPSVDGYIRKNKRWQDALQALRRIILDCELTEDVKWRAPCYTFEGGNVVMMGVFKESCVISFMKGALLKDAKSVLEKAGDNTQSARVIRFTNAQEIAAMAPVLKAYIREAIAVEKAGLKVDFKAKHELVIPEELQDKFDEQPALKKAFNVLTPGRQRAYVLYISSAKQSKTRASRVEKHVQRILDGKGLDD